MTAAAADESPEGDVVAVLRARLQVVLHHTDEVGDAAPVRTLHQESVALLGPEHEVSLFVECALEEALSRHRPPEESRVAWRGLLRRAERALSWDDTTLMSVRAFAAQYERRGGDAADLGRYEAEWNQRRRALGGDDYRTRIARANYAFALLERRQGTDLADARQLLDEEVAHRARHYGENAPFTWNARGLLAVALIRAGEAAAVELAEGLVRVRRARYGRFSAPAVRAQVLHVQALLAAGRPVEAATELRYLRTAVNRRRAALDESVVSLVDDLSSQGRPAPEG
ncbi:hypothetical protein [Cryptosporangium phraense]|uniref:Tetratricopeptide repeat protein n=1 Tax=Cryptosporangium phraense TaxID=2593070 RepID=A0A545AWC1_9ACTN|nr:hypothetical protein [Cryptosporangium phraense]TQS45620.1 hypothetical protein FL583_07795 [Cryptosporangium phraense]